jgi:hypothetical protein
MRADLPFGTADGSWLMIIQGTPIRSICALGRPDLADERAPMNSQP